MSENHAGQADGLSIVAMVMLAVAILFPLFIWFSVAVKG
jgi:hypothetical protein